MNGKTTILCAFGVLTLLFAGIAVVTNQPDTVICIRIPAWFRAAGSVAGLAGLVLWLRRELWGWIEPVMGATADWLNDDSEAH